jgi:hypothetical protein
MPGWNFGAIPPQPSERSAHDGAPAAQRAPGQPLDPGTQVYFESTFGFDFSRVKVRTDAAAAQSALAANANAYTIGELIVFGAGQFSPGTSEGVRLLSHELAHVVQQAGGGAPPGRAQEKDAEAASRAVEAGRRPRVSAPSGVGLAAQPRGLLGTPGFFDPLDHYRNAGVAFTTYEEVAKEIAGIMNAPGAGRAAGRADFNRDPARAKANLYSAHFRDNRERLSYAYGVFEEYVGIAGEGVDRDVLFATLVNFEISRIRGFQGLIVHERPTQDEELLLEQARGKQQVEKARHWEAGARQAHTLADVTRFATPARSHSDPLLTPQFEPRQPIGGSVQGYQFKAAELEPRDLLPKPEFRIYATDWERGHSGILVARGLAPVVGATPTLPWPGNLPVPSEYPLLGYIGYVTADSIYVTEEAPVVPGNPTETLATALANGLPVFAFTKIGRALEKETGFGGAEYLVSTDASGRVLQVWQVTAKAEPPIESVASPIDFFGPKLVTSLGRGLASVVAESLPAVAESLTGISGPLAGFGRTSALSLGLAMRGAGLPALTLEETPAAFVVRGETEATAGAQASEVATSTSSRLTPDLRTIEDVFREIHQELGLESPGTFRYPSTAAAAAAAAALGLHTSTRPGFHTHSTAPSVRRALGRSGNQWQSMHIVFQAAYRALRARGYVRPGGQPYSPGRALTTVDPSLDAHLAFDAGWVPLWNAAIASGQTITAGQVYQWLSNAINAVDPELINPAVQGAILDRIRTELFVELGLNSNDPIVP